MGAGRSTRGRAPRIRRGARGRFFNVVDLVNKLEAETRAGRQGRIADHLTRLDFVVLDELGYLPFAQAGGQLLFHLISRLDDLLAGLGDPMAPPTAPGEGAEGDVSPASPSVPGNAGALAERFGVPPFSILDARKGWWQDRKRAWLDLGIRSELGRGAAPGGSPRPLDRAKAREAAHG